MDVTLDVSTNISKVKAGLRLYERRQLPTMTQRALNKTINATPKIISD